MSSAPTGWLLGACAGTVLAVSAAHAQYRDNQPQVLQAPAAAAVPDESPRILEAFRSSYGAAGRPRIALFWNVALTDQLAEEKSRTTRIQGDASRSVNSLAKQTAGPAGNARLVEGDDKRSIDVVITSGTQSSDSAKRGSPLAERDAWLLEGAFAKSMLEGGTHFIDRNLIMRTTAASQEGGSTDSRNVETKALIGKAELLLEVLMTRDPDAPLGWGFRGTLREINSGRLLATYYSKAVPAVPKPPVQFQATPRGFEKVELRPVVTVEQVGRKLAMDTMDEIKGSFATPIRR